MNVVSRLVAAGALHSSNALMGLRLDLDLMDLTVLTSPSNHAQSTLNAIIILVLNVSLIHPVDGVMKLLLPPVSLQLILVIISTVL